MADTVEAEAMRPADLRAIVAAAFEPMLDRRRLDLLRIVEAAEKNGFEKLGSWLWPGRGHRGDPVSRPALSP